MWFFPTDQETINYLRLSGKDDQHLDIVATYTKIQKLWHDHQQSVEYDEIINFDLNKVVHGGTYNSNVVNTVAALKTIEEMDNNNFFKKLNNYRKKLTKEFINIATKKKLIINIILINYVL